MSVIILYEILFQIKKASETTQSYGMSFNAMENEIKVNEINSAPFSPPTQIGRTKKMFDYEVGDEYERSHFTPEDQFKKDFFLL